MMGVEIVKIQKNRKLVISILLILIILCIVGILLVIFFPHEKEVKKQKKEPTKVKKEETQKEISIVDLASDERPIAVMIDNNVGYSSHSGLQDAYLTYEIIVEGGLTRMMALYKNKNTVEIGPVRSSRHYFLDYALENDALYCHYGWSPYAQNDIKALSVNNINGMTYSQAFWRDNKVAAPHNVFTSIEKITNATKAMNYSNKSNDWQLLKYNADGVNLDKKNKENLQYALNVDIKYSYNQTRQYKYDTNSKTYLRFMNGYSHSDRNTNQQYNYKNIIVILVNNKTIDSEGRQDLDTVGTGNGYYITEGYSLPIVWSKDSRNSKTKFKYLDGEEVEVNDGNTFIQIVPLQMSVTFS